jgi:hypothetical protein
MVAGAVRAPEQVLAQAPEQQRAPAQVLHPALVQGRVPVPHPARVQVPLHLAVGRAAAATPRRAAA